MKIITDARCTEYHQAGHPERPQRVAKTVERLKTQKEIALEWAEPLVVQDAAILRAHTIEHLHGVQIASEPFDADTPNHPKIAEHARRAVGGALHALKIAREGGQAFSLLRPPGHHATRDRSMGFCYLNSIAITVLAARAAGVKRVAVFDFDVHHGNGTEAILHKQEGCAFFSIHQFPAYPGSGQKSFDNCHNYPVAPNAPREVWRKEAEKALADLKAFKPDLLGVSAGFDAYKRDPLCQQQLETEDFQWVGESLRKLGVPFFSTLEGGYSSDLPELVLAYLKGVTGK
ncbi:MAG: histone deacetylase [Pedosphaera sp.]|nr:histone deacetylase [Pedosphaera sp.]MST00464.1 histone deacetylase [Pedosphaera sp.]